MPGRFLVMPFGVISPHTAPQTTNALTAGAHVFRLTGGAKAMSAVLRINQKKQRLSASIGAPSGHFYQVSCGGRALGNTPVRGIRVRRGLRCKLTRADGGFMAFLLVVAK